MQFSSEVWDLLLDSEQEQPSLTIHDPPPPYQSLPKVGPIRGETLETLRAQNPPRTPPSDMGPTRPPRVSDDLEETSVSAIFAAVDGVALAMRETDNAMVVARSIQAIATAVSTSRSYAAFVAAITAAEFQALIVADDIRRSYDPDFATSGVPRLLNLWEVAKQAARDAHAATDAAPGAWPFNFDDVATKQGSGHRKVAARN